MVETPWVAHVSLAVANSTLAWGHGQVRTKLLALKLMFVCLWYGVMCLCHDKVRFEENVHYTMPKGYIDFPKVLMRGRDTASPGDKISLCKTSIFSSPIN